MDTGEKDQNREFRTSIQRSDQTLSHVPLAVDLDGTLIRTDLLLEAIPALIKKNPLCLFLLAKWAVTGKAYFKQQVARRVMLDLSSLPFRMDLLSYLRGEHERGRRLILATATDERFARQVADYLQLFDGVLASDGSNNLSGEPKRARLVAEFGERGFDYAGNSRPDLAVWPSARKAILVDARRLVRSAVLRRMDVERTCEDPPRRVTLYLRALRLHQWLKNGLVFVPLLASHRMNDWNLLTRAFLAFVAFGLCSSSVYVLNDLFDLSEDRRHPRKRHRPFASGDLPVSAGLALIPVLLGLSCIVSLSLPMSFLWVLGAYFSLTLVYSIRLKQVVLLDAIVLAGLFTARVLAGGAAVGIWPSSWLLAFSTFLFFSLALIKRYAELVTVRTQSGEHAKARGYLASDRGLLASLGCASGYVSVLVLALYINSSAAQELYGRREAIWLVCPLLLYWISYLWLVAHRGQMHDDPLVFALSDRVSRIIIGLMTAVAIVAV